MRIFLWLLSAGYDTIFSSAKRFAPVFGSICDLGLILPEIRHSATPPKFADRRWPVFLQAMAIFLLFKLQQAKIWQLLN